MTMPHDPWAAYVRQQEALSQATSVSDRTWGLEAALTEQVASISDGRPMSPDEVNRSAATAARRERHRKRLLAIYGPMEHGQIAHGDGNIHARMKLRVLGQRLNRFDTLLLLAVASGVSQTSVAERLFMSPEAVRQRVSRARSLSKDFLE